MIGTPGRILDMVSRRRLALSRVQLLVLDEGDEMLDAGFAPDVERIIEMTYQPQIVLASATMPEWVSRMITRHLDDPVRVVVAGPAEETLEHGLLRVSRPEKLRTLSRLLRNHKGSAIVFGRTKHGVRKLSRDLRNLGQGQPVAERPRSDYGRLSWAADQRPGGDQRRRPRARHQPRRPGDQL
ncbi:MAG: DEAD/DEAH box helicase [Chloroflexi bacterium]|nr:MAG: DEAD/DEAH box helicase [Chloroflexota bacterium]